MKTAFLKAYAARLSQEQGRKVSPQEADEDISATVLRVSRNVAASFIFGYHERSDIEQEAALYALEVIESERYDPGRPLENFLYVHVKRRLLNFRRQHFFRAEPPCSCCDTVGVPVDPCKKWLDWNRRNTCKQNLMRPLDVAGVSSEGEPTMYRDSTAVEDAILHEAIGLIDRGLPVELRADYLRMRTGVPVPKARRILVRAALLEILDHEE